jgi:hypothetical protein
MVKLIFEGMKAYKDESDDVWLFALMKITNDSTIQHSEWQCQRFLKLFSWMAKRIIKIDQAWIKGKGKHCTSDHL